MNGPQGHTGRLRGVLCPSRLVMAGLVVAGACWWVATSITRPFWR